MSNIKNKSVAIIGGGPGGLSLARLLQQEGIQVAIYERDRHAAARAPGATLDLHEDSGLLALETAGLMSAFEACYRPEADHMRVTDHLGHLHFDEQKLETKKSYNRPEIDRGPLQQLLLDSLVPGTVVWDSHITGLHQEAKGWCLHLSDGRTQTADLVVGADGARSRIRSFVTAIRPVYAGMTIIESAVADAATRCPELARLTAGGKVFALGKEQSLILSSKGDGSLVFYAGFKTAEDWHTTNAPDLNNKDEVSAWFRDTFREWSETWLSLFEYGDTPFIVRPQYYMPPDEAWLPQANITLIGDAAHLMPPYAGEGVNMAMLDALTLSKQLLQEDNMAQAIAAYEREMKQYAAEAARMTLASMEGLHGPDGVNFLLQLIS